MSMRIPALLALALLAVGSCASADTYYARGTYVQPYYGYAPAQQVYGYPTTGAYYSRPYCYYNDDPSVAGFVDRSAKTGVGVTAKAAKEAFKAIF